MQCLIQNLLSPVELVQLSACCGEENCRESDSYLLENDLQVPVSHNFYLYKDSYKKGLAFATKFCSVSRAKPQICSVVCLIYSGSSVYFHALEFL
jgi:hypothetical protein